MASLLYLEADYSLKSRCDASLSPFAQWPLSPSSAFSLSNEAFLHVPLESINVLPIALDAGEVLPPAGAFP